MAQTEQQELSALLRRVPLPVAYHAVELFYLNDGDEPTQRFELWVGPAWSVGVQSFDRPGLGFVPHEYFYGDLNETWRYEYALKAATRSDDFAKYCTNPFEKSSPASLVRKLTANPPGTVRISHEAGTTRATISDSPSASRRMILTFDDESGLLERLEQASSSGKVNSEHRFEDWRTLPSGSRVPYRIRTSVVPDLPGNPPFEMTVVRTEVVELDPAAAPARFGIPSDFLVVDEVEGVSRTADGEVLGPIVTGPPPGTGLRTGPPSSGGLSSRTVMLVGVGLILLAGIVFGVKRWKGA